jgi:hypothetical protein
LRTHRDYARAHASDRDDRFWSAGEEVFRRSEQSGPSLLIGSATMPRRSRSSRFRRSAAAQPVVYDGSESDHPPVEPRPIDDEYSDGVTRNEVVRISKAR